MRVFRSKMMRPRMMSLEDRLVAEGLVHVSGLTKAMGFTRDSRTREHLRRQGLELATPRMVTKEVARQALAAHYARLGARVERSQDVAMEEERKEFLRAIRGRRKRTT